MLFQVYLVLSNTLYMGLIGTLLFYMIRGQLTMQFTPRISKKEYATYETSEEVADVHDKQYSPLELERLADMAQFDARISMLKEEVANANLPEARRESRVVARESEGVVNLPHNAIYIKPSAHQLEIAD